MVQVRREATSMNDAWAVVAAALGSAVLTIAGTFWLEQWRLRRAAKAADVDRLREACVLMSSHTLLFALRAQVLCATAVLRSGIGEALDIVLYHRKPSDPMEIAAWLAVDLEPILKAQSLIEVTAGEELVRAAGDLVCAARAVLEKALSATSRSAGPDASVWHRIVSRFEDLVPLHLDPEIENAIQERVRELGRELLNFTRVTRGSLGVNDPDVVIRAFPGLFADACSTEADVKLR